MRSIILAGKNYKLAPGSDIIRRAINPFKGKLGTEGGLEYSDFGNASLEEWHDLRNGIGLESELPEESARLWWTEGIDFSTARSSVLGPLVTTAGSFGVAPVKIIDFKGVTYAIGHNQISAWNKTTSAWDSKKTNFPNPIDALVITDATAQYLVVSSAIGAIYTVDGTTWLDLGTPPTSGTITLRPDGAGSETSITYQIPSSTYHWDKVDEASPDGDTTCVYQGESVSPIRDLYALPVSAGSGIIDTVRVYFVGRKNLDVGRGYGKTSIRTHSTNYDGTQIALPISYTSYVTQYTTNPYTGIAWTWTEIDALEAGVCLQTLESDVFAYCTQVYVQVAWHTAIATFYGYLADYDARLYGIATDGKILLYSPANDIDGIPASFSLTGQFGTVFDLFEGKLLSDGTPTLYFCGTEGLFTIDTTAQKAYKQEVAYPPLEYAGHKGLYWNANVWVATGYGILKVGPSMATFVGPDLDDGLPSGYQGYIYDMVTVNNWLVFCVNAEGTGYSSILKRNSSLGGNLQVYSGALNTAIACLHHSPSSMYTNGRLWFGEGTNVKYMMFPDTTSNVKQISTYQYVDDSGYGKLPILRKLAAISKTALGVAAITKSCVDINNEYIEVFYGLNGAAPTTSLGTFLTSPKPTTLTFNSGLGTAFYTIQFATKLYRGATATNSPELESLMFYYLPTPTRISGWVFNIDATGPDGDDIFTEFEAIYDLNLLTPFYPSGDTNKSSYNVKLTQMPSREWFEEQGAKEGQFQCVCEEVFKG